MKDCVLQKTFVLVAAALLLLLEALHTKKKHETFLVICYQSMPYSEGKERAKN